MAEDRILFFYFVHLAEFRLSVLLEKDWICAHDPKVKPSEIFEAGQTEGWNAYNLCIWHWDTDNLNS